MKRSNFFILTFFISILFSGQTLFAADFPDPDYPDTSDVRTQILTDWLTGELNLVRLMKPANYENLYGDRFNVRQKMDKSRGILAVTVTPMEKKGAEGEWILWRRLSDGLPERISVYPVSNRNIRIDVRPEGSNPEKGRSYLDLVIYGSLAVHDAPVGIPFTNLYTVPLASIVSLTAKTVPWDLLAPDLNLYGDSADAVATIRDRLKTLVYLEDGVIDEKGNAVMRRDRASQDPVSQDPARIWESLAKDQKAADVVGGVDFAGFAKWIVDGIVAPAAGEGTHIEPLLTRTVGSESAFAESESDNLFFALDWTRNLASAVVSLDRNKAVKPDVSGVDVSVTVFSGSCVYQKNVGYRTSELAPLLYWLAVREPGHLYLGAVSQQRNVPPEPHFYGIIVFFPYFDKDGKFSVAVFENARETTLEAFIATNGDSFTNLARVRVPEAARFDP